jgi:uncharacterized OB-fold protein
MTIDSEKIAIQYFKCNGCGHAIAAEARVCPKCGKFGMEKKESSGKGSFLESAITYYPPDSHKHLAPYTSVMINMDEGFRTFGVMEGEVKDIKEGDRLVAVRIDEKSGSIIYVRA